MLDTLRARKLSGPASSGPNPLLRVLTVPLRDAFVLMKHVRGGFPRLRRQGRRVHDAMDWLAAEAEAENQGYRRM
ncbi:hypothetical protein [Streptomyces griseus]|uniref:hypothetical protein n=1 Tax=Streptomyces griseus TaxID=1911 RepID=UPI001112F9D6|nr:hypothetical protein [Streptomyces griseus]